MDEDFAEALQDEEHEVAAVGALSADIFVWHRKTSFEVLSKPIKHHHELVMALVIHENFH